MDNYPKIIPVTPSYLEHWICHLYEMSAAIIRCLCKNHGGESHDILHLYSDRMDKNIRHYFSNIQ